MRCEWGDLISLEYGKPVSDKDSVNGKYPVFGTNGQIGTSNLPPLCPHSSFVIGRKGAYRGVHYSDVPFSVIDTAFYVESKKPDILDIKWAYYKFLTYDINHMDSGSAIPSTDRYEIYSIDVDLPSIDVQKKIAAILSALDEKIATNRAINENLERQAQAMVSEYAERTLYSSVFSDIMNFDNGFAFQSSTYLPSGKYKIITIKNVQDGYIDSTGSAFIDSLPQRMKDNCILNIGDVLLSLTGNVGRVGIVCEENLLLNQRVAKIVPIDNKLLPFLYFVFRQSGIKTKLETIAKGTAQLNLSPIETLKLTIPYEESSAIQLSQLLEPLYRKIINNNQECYSFALLRDTLLPKLMSGEIDVSAVQL